MTFPSEKIRAPRPPKSAPAEAEEAAPQNLGEFLGEVRESARFVAEFSADLARTPLPGDFNAEQLSQVAQTLFETEMIRRKTFKDFVLLHRLRQAARSIDLRAETLALSRERFHFRAAEAVFTHFEKIRAIHENQSLPQPEKIERMRAILFAALPLPAADIPAADFPGGDSPGDDLDPA